MRQYAAALDGVKAQASNIGAGRTVAGTVNALVAAYLDPHSSSPFKTGAAETRRTRRNILENFRKAHGRQAAVPHRQQRPPDHVADARAHAADRQREGGDAIRTAQFPQHAAGDVQVGNEGRPHPR